MDNINLRTKVKVSDFIVEYLIEKNIKHIFGYPGGMITHFMDSLAKYQDQILAHSTYHEQAAAFAACGYAQANGKIGVAYATSGPGATNLITGICNAYFDSIPVLFLTGQVNSFEQKETFSVRQRGFQETDIVSMVKGVTKYAVSIKKAEEVPAELEHAYKMATCGRKGAVLLDIPMDVWKTEIDLNLIKKVNQQQNQNVSKPESAVDIIADNIKSAKRPVFLFGQGIKSANAVKAAQNIVLKFKIPCVSTMLATDVYYGDLDFGFIGAYGHRTANFIVADCDLLVSFGARLDIRQVGANRENFAPHAKIIRIDIDPAELKYQIREDEIDLLADLNDILNRLNNIKLDRDFLNWVQVCQYIRKRLQGMDDKEPNKFVADISRFIPEQGVVTADVGQNQVWIAQSFQTKGHTIFTSGGHGAMGYSLPAAVGCAFATKETVYSFHGDGGIQMNIQELQTIVREKLPVKIILLNNYSLGMIRHFQEMYFDKNYIQTTKENGYSLPDFEKIAAAYGIPYKKVHGEKKLTKSPFQHAGAEFLEVVFSGNTYVFPKLQYGKPNHDQEPFMDRELYDLLENPERVEKILTEEDQNKNRLNSRENSLGGGINLLDYLKEVYRYFACLYYIAGRIERRCMQC